MNNLRKHEGLLKILIIISSLALVAASFLPLLSLR